MAYDIEKRRRATRLRVKRFRAKLKQAFVTPVTGRRVIRTDFDAWVPPVETEQKLLAEIKDLRRKGDQLDLTMQETVERRNVYYRRLGIIEPAPNMTLQQLYWIERELTHRIREIHGSSKASKAERAHLQEMRNRAEEMIERRE